MLVDHALQYAGRGWPVFRVTGFKTPLKGSHGHLDATTDRTTIEQWWAERPKTNIALACGTLVVLDLDGPGALSSERGRSLKALADAHGGLPVTLTSRTARGLHLFYQASPGVPIRASNERRADKGADGVDIKGEGGWVILPPSINAKNGFIYRWLNDVPIASLPEWLSNWMQTVGKPAKMAAQSFDLGAEPDYLKQKQSRIGQRSTDISAIAYSVQEHQRIWGALQAIPADSYDLWIEVGLALHSLDWETAEGSSIAFDLWNRWSALAPEKYNAIGMADKWASFGRNGRSDLTIATVFHHAANNGWQQPAAPAVEEVMPHTTALEPPGRTEHNALPHSAPLPGGVNGHAAADAVFPNQPESPLIKLNDQYAVIGDLGGKCLVMGWIASKVDETVKVPSFQSFRSFAERYANKYVMAKRPKGDQWVEEPAQLGASWLKWGKRRTYEAIDLVPGEPPVLSNNVLNLWQGFAVEPAHGDWSRLRAHIAKVLARSDAAAAEYIFRWAAWKVQHPGERAEVALVFKGPKGSGKGTFANSMRRLFGQHGLQIWNSKHLVGAFNGHLRNCLLLYADEAFWAGDKQGESVLKGMLTERSLMIEQKGVDATPWKNRLGVIMTTNADWVVPATHDERRYAVFEVADDHLKDEPYFDAIYDEIAAGGLGAMLHDLQRLQLGNWHPRRILQTEALQTQKLKSLDPRYEWFESFISDGMLPAIGKDTHQVASHIIYNIAKETVPRLRDLSQAALGRFLADMGCEKVHNEKGNTWRFLDLGEHRARWERRFGKWRWANGAENWVIR